MFDIKSISDTASSEVEIKNPLTGEGVGAFVTLAGPEHPDRKAMEFARQRRMRAEIQRTGKLAVSDPEEDEQDQLDVLATCTLGWRGFADDGAEIAFSKDAAKKLLGGEGMAWLRGQLLGALQERDRFIKTSAPT